jgi:glycerol-3-phosphate acyltransferase PlsY
MPTPPQSSLLDLPSLIWVLVVLAYLLGAIPFGLVLARWLKGIDLRQFGSGNIGTTNAIRALGRKWGLAVFALDFLKGFLPVLVCLWLLDSAEQRVLAQVLAGTASVLGHCFSIYLRFGGGKGVATGCGAIVAMDPLVFVIGGIVWLLTRAFTGYSGLSSILMGVTFPVVVWLQEGPRPLLVGAGMLCLLILVRHRSNIQRMLAGTEPRAGEKHKNPDAPSHG